MLRSSEVIAYLGQPMLFFPTRMKRSETSSPRTTVESAHLALPLHTYLGMHTSSFARETRNVMTLNNKVTNSDLTWRLFGGYYLFYLFPPSHHPICQRLEAALTAHSDKRKHTLLTDSRHILKFNPVCLPPPLSSHCAFTFRLEARGRLGWGRDRGSLCKASRHL